MVDYYEMGARIAALRKENAITQEKLAEILDISVKHCSEVERGISSLSLEKLIFLSDYFHCSMDYLVRGLDANHAAHALPAFVIEIMESDDRKERQLLMQYLQMYGKLRKDFKK
ncbi:MAG: helix-turn-helix domain-containing protein [Agathobacter sp.]|nr:helix-turn-helix domain-containing protein [Agathobacter sp.]